MLHVSEQVHMHILREKHIVYGVCGSIAAYKAVEVVSQLQQAGALVDVIMTERAAEFVRPLTFSALSHRPVYDDLWEPTGQAAAHHISLGTQADLLVVAPATATTIARLATGMADDMLSAVALASTAPLLIVPAMEHHMYQHPAMQANLATLHGRGAFILDPVVGRLASGTTGMGRFPDLEDILGAIRATLGHRGNLAGRRMVVTAGGTQEPIDPVRYISNRSSGLMGYAIAEAARDRGAQVTLISGPVALRPPYGMQVISVHTAQDMLAAVQRSITGADALVMAAAVADYRVAEPATQKIKKDASGDDALTLRLVHNPDILGTLAAGDSPGQSHVVRVGFAAETTNLEEYARAKLTSKRLDLLVANDVSRPDSGFGTPTNKVFIVSRDGSIEDLPLMTKEEVANSILDRVSPLLASESENSPVK
jgi:phosphopantothenoylcysteine decarboxylase/phosphopantothenate--cysteine ligase